MNGQNLHTIIRFKDKNTNDVLRLLLLVNSSRMLESIRKTIIELTEKYCLPEQDILVETN